MTAAAAAVAVDCSINEREAALVLAAAATKVSSIDVCDADGKAALLLAAEVGELICGCCVDSKEEEVEFALAEAEEATVAASFECCVMDVEVSEIARVLAAAAGEPFG